MLLPVTFLYAMTPLFSITITYPHRNFTAKKRKQKVANAGVFSP